jgi:hypothetical protein
MPITIDGTNGITQAGEFNSDSSFGFKNRIINGAMVIDQRNAGASVTITTANQYTLDRFQAFNTQSSKFSVQQNAGSVTPPVGFSKYLGVTSSSAYSVLSGDIFGIAQVIEGFNMADLDWGTANAKTITISFWVQSSLTGTFGGSLVNGSFNYSYPFSYTISSANTWEQKSVTVAGPTAGTWAGSVNTAGIYLVFGLGGGSSSSGTAGAWTANGYSTATGATSVVGTDGATFYITGVQLEKGSTATSFDVRPYGTELALCQRYFEKSYSISTAVATNTAEGYYTMTSTTNENNFLIFPLRFKVEKRAASTITGYQTDGTVGNWSFTRSGSSGTNAVNADNIGTGGCRYFVSTGAAYTAGLIEGHWTASAEL